MANRQPRLPLTMEPAELLVAVADALPFLGATFPGVDLALEAHKCTAYWNNQGGAKNWRLAFMNWVQVASKPRPFKAHNDGRGMTRGAPDMDRGEFLRDFERRRGMA